MAKLLKEITVDEQPILLYQTAILTQETTFDASQLQEAKQKSYELGKKEGLEIAHNQLGQLQKKLESLMHSIPEALIKARLSLQEEMVQILWSIIQGFFIEKQKNKEALALQINDIIKHLNDQEVELHLHPDDLKASLQLNTSALKYLHIKGNDSLKLGGCFIKTNHGLFDASIESQVDKLKEKLLQLRQGNIHVA